MGLYRNSRFVKVLLPFVMFSFTKFKSAISSIFGQGCLQVLPAKESNVKYLRNTFNDKHNLLLTPEMYAKKKPIQNRNYRAKALGDIAA